MNEIHITQSDIDRYMPILRGLKQFEKENEFGDFIIKVKNHRAIFVEQRPSIHLKLANSEKAKVI